MGLDMLVHRFERNHAIKPLVFVTVSNCGHVGAIEKPNRFGVNGTCVDDEITLTWVEEHIRVVSGKLSPVKILHIFDVVE